MKIDSPALTQIRSHMTKYRCHQITTHTTSSVALSHSYSFNIIDAHTLHLLTHNITTATLVLRCLSTWDNYRNTCIYTVSYRLLWHIQKGLQLVFQDHTQTVVLSKNDVGYPHQCCGTYMYMQVCLSEEKEDGEQHFRFLCVTIAVYYT